MFFYGMRSLPGRFRLLLCSLQQSDSLPFSAALTEEQIEEAFEEEGIPDNNEDQVFTPAITLWGFLSQTLHKAEQRSCLAAVARIGVLLLVMGRPRCAENNGPYCRVRIAELYHASWLVELDIRSIKCTMGMDELRCKSPEMVRKEIWTCLLAYNMIRQKMLQSALDQEISPRAMSFTNTLQMIASAWMVMPLLNAQTSRVLLKVELEKMADQTVGKRPGRVEPRALKRRSTRYRLFTMVRSAAQALLRRGINPYQN